MEIKLNGKATRGERDAEQKETKENRGRGRINEKEKKIGMKKETMII